MELTGTEKILYEYALKFGEIPPLPYGRDYDDEEILEAIDKAMKTGEKITLDTYSDDLQERVITS
jgi:hypothetical protein